MRKEIKEGFTRGRAHFENKINEVKNHDNGIKKKILLSAGLGVTVFSANWIAPFIIKESDWFKSLSAPSDLDSGIALGLVYVANFSILLINLNQQRRLLQNENIEMNQDISATVAYHGLEKIKSLKKKRTSRSLFSVLTPALFAIPGAIARDSSIYFSSGAWELTLFKSAQTAFNLVQMGAAEVALRTKGKEKKKIKKLPNRGTIVDIGQKS